MQHEILKKSRLLKIRGDLTSLKVPKIMGILNVTPDSFYDGGKYNSELGIKNQIAKMVQEGADIIDIGGYSSRPGAVHISEKEEIERVARCLEIVKKWFPECVISIDTFRSGVAKMALEAYKVDIVNDISGGEMDPKIGEVVARYGATYVLMHMQGNPQNMQQKPTYKNVVTEVIQSLHRNILRLESLGLKDIVIDPGFGFGKTIEHNYTLLSQLKMFNLLSKPILVGISRKSMLYKPLEITPAASLNVTTSGHVLALLGGADILRVHDVKEAKETLQLVQLAQTSNYQD